MVYKLPESSAEYEDAQEAMQDVFLKVNDGIGTFRGEAVCARRFPHR